MASSKRSWSMTPAFTLGPRSEASYRRYPASFRVPFTNAPSHGHGISGRSNRHGSAGRPSGTKARQQLGDRRHRRSRPARLPQADDGNGAEHGPAPVLPAGAGPPASPSPCRLASRSPSGPSTSGTWAYAGTGSPSAPGQPHLPGRRVEQVVAPHHLADALVVVVDHDRHLVGGRAVGPAHDEVVDHALDPARAAGRRPRHARRRPGPATQVAARGLPGRTLAPGVRSRQVPG